MRARARRVNKGGEVVRRGMGTYRIFKCMDLAAWGGDESLAEKDPELEGHSNPLDSELGSAPLHPEDLRKLLKSEGRAGWIVTA